MEIQKIINLLNGSSNENSNICNRKWYLINDESKGNYSQENVITYLTESIESSLYDYSDAYIFRSSASKSRARRSDAAASDKDKQICFVLMPRT